MMYAVTFRLTQNTRMIDCMMMNFQLPMTAANASDARSPKVIDFSAIAFTLDTGSC